MPLSRELYLAILAMDSYNRGYDAGTELVGSDLGGAAIGTDSEEVFDGVGKDVSFFAQSYDISGVAGVEGLGDATTVVSYRGTDNPDFLDFASDVWTGWTIGTGYSEASQAGLTVSFFESAVGGNKALMTGAVTWQA